MGGPGDHWGRKLTAESRARVTTSGTAEGAGSFGFTVLIFVQSPRQGPFWNWEGLACPEGTSIHSNSFTEAQVLTGPDKILL